MRNVRPWTLAGVGLLVAFLTVALIYAAVAQPPAKAPVPAETRDPEDDKVPPMPRDRERVERVRERAEAIRNTWTDAALLSGRGAATSTIVVEGDHVYVLYGPYLCQLSVDGLRLEAKIDLREALGLTVDREVRDRLRGAKEARKARVAEPEAAEAEEAEEEGEQ